ncbi:MAG: SMP-30/gluconolactonase/LRE family protein [Flammeovirgaceae bacterium]|nr:SMP-30/gluconolactonase/LRE family protein [Flammeovirgaceae bacterium]
MRSVQGLFRHHGLRIACALAGFLFLSFASIAQESVELAMGQANAVVNLRTKEGVALVKGEWRYSDAQIIDKDFKAPGPSADDKLALYPTGRTIKTHDIAPKAGAKNFDDSQWKKMDPTTLEERRGTGLLSFNWYRISITIPEKLENFSTEGSTVVFEIVVDDYAEIFVDGVLKKSNGQSGGGVVKGWNARNRIIIGKVKPGQVFQLAVLGMNAPVSDLPENYIWVRSATLDFYQSFPKNPDWQNVGEVVKIDASLDKIIIPGTKLEKLAMGFQFTEGPVWHPDGYLVFSDPNTNVIYSYKPENGNVEIYRTKSGYAGINIGEYHQPGSNGLTFDKEGRLTVCQHGDRRVVRIEKKGPVTVLADNYQGKKLNSPNDLVYRSDGMLFFTDPPYGLPKAFNDSRKETPHSGVYAVVNGQAKLLTTDLKGPNGIAFSPDEKYLYVSNWDITDIHNTKVIMRYEVAKDGSLSNGIIFFDMNKTDGEDALDGLKTDTLGNVFCSGPDGIWIISAEGKYLGRIKTPEHAANMAWGEDGHTLFIAASAGLYKIRLLTGGKMPGK